MDMLCQALDLRMLHVLQCFTMAYVLQICAGLGPMQGKLRLGIALRSYGYDPLGLGKDAEQVEKYRAYELLHARWAMLAAAGIIIPEGLQVNENLFNATIPQTSFTSRCVCNAALG